MNIYNSSRKVNIGFSFMRKASEGKERPEEPMNAHVAEAANIGAFTDRDVFNVIF